MRAGDTFFLKDKNINDHLFVIISDPAINDEQVVFVSMTSEKEYKEKFCLISVGEHPYVSKPTCISYFHAKKATLNQLVKWESAGDIVLDVPVSSALLIRIRRGVPLSNEMPIGLAAIIARQRLF